MAQNSTLDTTSSSNNVERLSETKWLSIPHLNCQVNYEVSGYGEPTIVFVHGLATNMDCWKKQVEFFQRKMRVVNINLPYVGDGWHYNTNIDYTFDVLADVVYEVIKDVRASNVVFVGHSSGLAVGRQLVFNHPGVVAKFVNVDGSGWFYPPEDDPNRAKFIDWLNNSFLASVSKPEVTADFINRMCPVGVTNEDIRAYVEKCIYGFPPNLAENLFYNITREQLWLPKQWDVETLCIYAKPPDMVKEVLLHSNAQIVVVDSVGHFIQMEKPQVVNEVVNGFVFKK